MQSLLRRPHILVLLATAIVSVLALAYTPWWTVDDAFISYRYGKNLLTTGALNWNPGEKPVEGYTGQLLPLLTAAILAMGLPLLNTLKVLGILAMYALLALSYAAMRRIGATAIVAATATLLMASSPLLYLHSLSGLETIFFAASLSWIWRQMAFYGNSKPPYWVGLGLALAMLLAAVCRPEGIALPLLFMLLAMLFRRSPNTFIDKGLIFTILGFVLLPIASIWLWRLCYYGDLFPNSYYAKVYPGMVNLESVYAFGKFLGYYLFLPALIVLLTAGHNLRARFEGKSLLLGLVISFTAVCLFAYFRSQLWMNYGSRFFFPFYSGLIIALVGIVSSPKAPSSDRLPNWKIAILIIIGGLQIGVLGFRYHQEWAFLHYYDAIVKDELISNAQDLEATLPANAKIISFMDAGALGYYCNAKIVDFGRLNDSYLAQNTLSQTEVNNYFFGQAADVVVMTSESKDSLLYIDEAMAIVHDPRFQQYTLRKIWGNHVGYPYWQFVYHRKN